MRRLSIAFGRKLAPHRPKLLHLVFLGSLGGLIAGWFLLGRLGPMSIILPVTLAIGAGLSEVDLLFCPVLQGGARLHDRMAAGKGEPGPWSIRTQSFAGPMVHERSESEGIKGRSH
jgi:hypothetical protein